MDFEKFSRVCFAFHRLSACLGGLMLKLRQNETVWYSLGGKDILAVLLTGFRERVIYHE